MSKQTGKLSIIIVNFNTKDLLRSCLASLLMNKSLSKLWQIMVIDNGSEDGSGEMVRREFPRVELIVNQKNLGFAKANNLGITKATGEFILLLNSDTQPSPAAILETWSFLEQHPAVGVVTCKLQLPDGRMDPACHRGFPTPWAALTYFLGLERLFPRSKLFGQYHQGYKDLDTVHEIDSPSGAFFLVRREVIDEVGLLDENFFMYGEDLDWAYRIKLAGWKIFYNPEVSILHMKKQSGRAHEDIALRKQTQQYFFDTMALFYKKHYAKKYGFVLYALVMFGIKLRSLF